MAGHQKGPRGPEAGRGPLICQLGGDRSRDSVSPLAPQRRETLAMARSPRPYDSVGGPDLLDAMAKFIDEYRVAGEPAPRQQEATLARFPNASGGDYAVALVRANRRRDAR